MNSLDVMQCNALKQAPNLEVHAHLIQNSDIINRREAKKQFADATGTIFVKQRNARRSH